MRSKPFLYLLHISFYSLLRTLWWALSFVLISSKSEKEITILPTILLKKAPPPVRGLDNLPPGLGMNPDWGQIALLAGVVVCAILLIWLTVRMISRKQAALRTANQRIFSLDLRDDKLRWTFTLPNLFVWNVQANPEKGTAGGSVKLTFTPRTALITSLGFLVLAVAAQPITKLVIPSIFLFFTVYYLRVALARLGARLSRHQGINRPALE